MGVKPGTNQAMKTWQKVAIGLVLVAALWWAYSNGYFSSAPPTNPNQLTGGGTGWTGANADGPTGGGGDSSGVPVGPASGTTEVPNSGGGDSIVVGNGQLTTGNAAVDQTILRNDTATTLATIRNKLGLMPKPATLNASGNSPVTKTQPVTQVTTAPAVTTTVNTGNTDAAHSLYNAIVTGLQH